MPPLPNPRWAARCLSEGKVMKEQKTKKDTLLRILSYLAAHRAMMILAVVLTLAANGMALLVPELSGRAIDAIGNTGNVNFSKVFVTAGWMIAAVIGECLFTYLTQIILIRLSARVTAEMRREVFEHLLSLPISFFDRVQAGDIISRISYDIDTINTSLSSDIITVSTSIITVLGSFVMMVRISLPLCLVFAVTIPLIIFITRQRTMRVRPLFHLRSRKLGELNGFVEEMLSGHKTIKAYGQENTILSRFDEKNDTAVNTYYDADYQSSIVGPLVNFVNNLSLSLISCFGGLLFLIGRISLGSISSFIMYSRKFSGPISETANILADLQSAISAARRVFELIDELPEKADAEDAVALNHVRGDVSFVNVHFSYEEGKEIIHGLNLEAKAGQMIAIVGPTGAGKTTIINLLMRFYDPSSGSIRVDGNDIQHVTRDSLRKQFSMVLQDTWLFTGTIYENVAYGRDDVTKEEVINACKAADIHDFIMSLSDGYDTVLSDDGVNISKGQKQLLTIARAMLSKTRMLILDEATSNVDSNTEQKIQKAMMKLCENKTTFIIAHRLSTIQNADQILVLQKGTVIEHGTHEELLAEKGFYSSLFNAQWES